MDTTHNQVIMLAFTTLSCAHLYFLVGTDCARTQWFEVGGHRYKKQGNMSYENHVLLYIHNSTGTTLGTAVEEKFKLNNSCI